jgi:DNA-binding transcriptional MerR regulator
MNAGIATNEPLEGYLYPIGTVSSLTGVPPITLRAWERRYGLIQPHRKPSGHRLFTREDIDLIHRVVAFLEDGMRIGQVRERLLAESQNQDITAAPTVWDSYRSEMIAAIVQFDEQRLESTYGSALSLHPVDTVTRQLLTPLLIDLGERWQSGAGSIAEEHFFAFYLRNTLGARFHHRQRDNSGRRILAACMPGEHHEIGLLLFGLAAHQAGLQLVLLGADTPLQELAATASIANCEAIVLSGAIVPETSVIEEQLASLTKETELPVFIGGLTSVDCCEAIEHVGAVALGSDIGQGLKRLTDTLESRS